MGPDEVIQTASFFNEGGGFRNWGWELKVSVLATGLASSGDGIQEIIRTVPNKPSRT
jgi:hypothetical protein